LALAQANLVLALCRAAFPQLVFEQKIFKTTGDKFLSASLTNPSPNLPKGLFTKELEVALLKGQADFAVHSLKDLPVELPAGLVLGAVTKRADVRDVLVYRDADWLAAAVAGANALEWVPGQARRRGFRAKARLKDLPADFIIATSSARRMAQIHAHRPDLKLVEIRGNVISRLDKVANRSEMDATILAAAGLERLNFTIGHDGHLHGEAVPDGLFGTRLEIEEMIPCVGQAALGIEIRAGDQRLEEICAQLSHHNTLQAITAERTFLGAMGGGCHSSSAACAEVAGNQLHMRAIAFIGSRMNRAEARRPLAEAVELGQFLAAELSGK
jgi:porphobilinogen deaminase